MSISRRTLLKAGAGLTLATVFSGLPFNFTAVAARADIARLKWTKQTPSICCYCAVGCGIMVNAGDKAAGNSTDRVINLEGDPDHPINEGSLCAKGAGFWQIAENQARPTKPMYRAPKSKEWKEVEWDWAMDRIAANIKTTRDATFTEKNDKGEKVNRTLGIASFGTSSMDNEESWAIQALMRSIGAVYIEHQARL